MRVTFSGGHLRVVACRARSLPANVRDVGLDLSPAWIGQCLLAAWVGAAIARKGKQSLDRRKADVRHRAHDRRWWCPTSTSPTIRPRLTFDVHDILVATRLLRRTMADEHVRQAQRPNQPSTPISSLPVAPEPSSIWRRTLRPSRTPSHPAGRSAEIRDSVPRTLLRFAEHTTRGGHARWAALTRWAARRAACSATSPESCECAPSRRRSRQRPSAP
jgi:hypothetical protein